MEWLTLHGDILAEILVTSHASLEVSLSEETALLSVDEVGALPALWVLIVGGVGAEVGLALVAGPLSPGGSGWGDVGMLGIWVLSNALDSESADRSNKSKNDLSFHCYKN